MGIQCPIQSLPLPLSAKRNANQVINQGGTAGLSPALCFATQISVRLSSKARYCTCKGQSLNYNDYTMNAAQKVWKGKEIS